jgi:hypothetical protein
MRERERNRRLRGWTEREMRPCGGERERERCGHAGDRDAAMQEGRERCGWVGGKGDKVSWLGERR